MFILGYFLKAVAVVLNIALTTYMWVIIIRAVLSWVSPDPYNPIVRFIYTVTEPALRQVRAWLPIGYGGIDFSPIIVILGIIFAQTFLVNSLLRLAMMFI